MTDRRDWSKYPPYRIGFAGVTTEGDVWAVSNAAADAIVLSFDPASPQCVSSEIARDLETVAHICGLATVGRVVATQAIAVAAQCVGEEFGVLELHGAHRAEFIREVVQRGIESAPTRDSDALLDREWWWTTKSFRVGLDELSAIEELATIDEFVAECQRLDAPLSAVVVELAEDGAVDRGPRWEALASWPGRAAWPALVLVDRLDAANVEQAIKLARPDSIVTTVGTSRPSAVESLDPMRAFSSRAKRAFREIRSRP